VGWLARLTSEHAVSVRDGKLGLGNDDREMGQARTPKSSKATSS